MAAGPHSFKRLVLGLQPSAPDRSMQLAVELAELLDLELLGLFLEDAGLRDFAAMPFARELQLLGGGWHPVSLERLSDELDLAARSAERMFTAASEHLSIPCQFEVMRGQMATAIAAVSQASDIVMIVEPASIAERTSQPFSGLLQAAFRSSAAVMFVPTPVARARGPIVAIASALIDPSIAVAATVALAADEEMIVLDIGEHAIEAERLRALAGGRAPHVRRVMIDKEICAETTAITRELDSLRERFVVMTRSGGDERAVALLAAQRRIPVLVVEPGAETVAAGVGR